MDGNIKMFTRLKRAPLFYTYAGGGCIVIIQDAAGRVERFYNCGLDYAVQQYKKLHGMKRPAALIRY